MLTRFRANPSKVRVAMRRDGALWLATVTSRDPHGPVFEARATGPRKALVLALNKADEAGLPGVDLSMGSVYRHPQSQCATLTS